MKPERDITPRQRDVIVRLAMGDTHKEAGRALGISDRTVEDHLEKAGARLGVRLCGAMAANLAIMRGWIQPQLRPA